jgi:tRNA pseudouridine38-40 synthase
MKKNIKLIIAYDGTHYLGWQKTKMGPSIEETVQVELERILQEKIVLQAASRTDAGVHAENQVLNFFTENADLDCRRLLRSLNGLLPNDISVKSVSVVPEDFHPTVNCQSKEYHYYLCNHELQLPFFRRLSWHYFYPLNLDDMRAAAEKLVGKHDFSAFCNDRIVPGKDAVRTIHRIEIDRLEDGRVRVAIRGNKFLYRMVRNIVGTLAYIGSEKLPLDAIPQILTSGDRTQAGMTAPAHGLSLHQVFYPGTLENSVLY